MTKKGLGATLVVDSDGRFVGLVTDGIIRRAVEQDYRFLDKKVSEVMCTNPLTVSKDDLATTALSIMEKHQPRPVTVLPVIENGNIPAGIVHLTDLLRQGVI